MTITRGKSEVDLKYLHCQLQGFSVGYSAVATPLCNAVGQDALNSTAVIIWESEQRRTKPNKQTITLTLVDSHFSTDHIHQYLYLFICLHSVFSTVSHFVILHHLSFGPH